MAKKVIKLLFCIIICQLAGVVGSLFTAPEIDSWFKTLIKPSFSPPNWLFAPVWTILFLLMGISLYLVWDKNWVVKNEIGNSKQKIWNSWSRELAIGKWQKINIILIFAFQLILNILWSVIFFGMHSPMVAFFEVLTLWVAILFTIVNFYRVSKLAAYLLVPYIVWVSFAAILNCFLWILN